MLLALLVVLVTYQVISFSDHMHHIPIVALDMADAVNILVYYE